ILVDGYVGRGSALFARQGALAEIGQEECIQRTEGLQRSYTDHRLTEFYFLFDRVLDQVGLVYRVDEVNCLGDAPEDLVRADAEFPVVRIERVAGLANVPMAALAVALVYSSEGREDEGLVIVVPAIFRRCLTGEGERRVFLRRAGCAFSEYPD